MCLPYFRDRQDRFHPGQGQDFQIQRHLLDLRKVPHFRSIRYRKSCQRRPLKVLHVRGCPRGDHCLSKFRHCPQGLHPLHQVFLQVLRSLLLPLQARQHHPHRGA